MNDSKRESSAVGFSRQSRRTSLLALGGAALGALLKPGATAKAKSRGKQAKRRANRRCTRQGTQCRAFVAARICLGAPDPAACEAAYASCCEIISGCQGGEFIECLLENVA